VWLTVTKKLEVSQECNISPTAMPVSLNDMDDIQHSTNVQTLYLMLSYSHLLSFFHFDGYFSRWTCISQNQNVFVVDSLELRIWRWW